MESMSHHEKVDPGHWHSMSVKDVISSQTVDINKGLTQFEVQERLERYGPNTLPEQKSKSTLFLFLKQFQSPLIYLLFTAAAIAFFLKERSDAFVILVVVFLNSVIGAFQEGKAERSLESLKNLSKLMVKVRRDSREQQIEAKHLVPGDILLLGAGDAIGADGRIVVAKDFRVAEAALTGESLPVEKEENDLMIDTGLADRKNMVYSGTFVTAGRAIVVVVETGERTEVGKIATLTSQGEELKTPLEKK